jgi:hypothetical protein
VLFAAVKLGVAAVAAFGWYDERNVPSAMAGQFDVPSWAAASRATSSARCSITRSFAAREYSSAAPMRPTTGTRRSAKVGAKDPAPIGAKGPNTRPDFEGHAGILTTGTA